jgi:hypothetical protein
MKFILMALALSMSMTTFADDREASNKVLCSNVTAFGVKVLNDQIANAEKEGYTKVIPLPSAVGNLGSSSVCVLVSR